MATHAERGDTARSNERRDMARSNERGDMAPVMTRAIEAAAGTPRTLPNPRVGCVLMDPRTDTILAIGVHRGAGTAHAEVDALAQAGDRARGATAIITLEPCHHTGRTGPCTRALIDAGVARIVYGQADPNPDAGGGAAALAASGIEVQGGLMAAEAGALNREWTFAITHRRPHVTWKFAATVDGFSADSNGTSQWISSVESRQDVHRWRAECDAIMAGAATVEADNPRLTARDGTTLPPERQPTRVIMGMRDLPPGLSAFDDGAATMRIRSRDPKEALAVLFEQEFRHVWLEGGPHLAGAFLREGFIDRVVGYLAPGLLGGGMSALITGATSLDEMRRFDVESVGRSGADIRLIGTFGEAT